MPSKSCLLCTIAPHMQFARFVAFTPYNFSCFHEDYYERRPVVFNISKFHEYAPVVINISKFYVAVSTIITIMLTCIWYMSFVQIKLDTFGTACETSVEFLFNTNALVLLLIRLTHMGYHRHFLLELVAFSRNPELYGLKDIVGKVEAKRMHRFCRNSCFITVIYVTVLLIYLCYENPIQSFYEGLKVFGILINTYVQQLYIIDVTTRMKTYKVVVDNGNQKLMKSLRTKQNEFPIRTKSALKRMCGVQRLYLVIYNSFYRHMEDSAFIGLWFVVVTGLIGTLTLYNSLRHIFYNLADMDSYKHSQAIRMVGIMMQLNVNRLEFDGLCDVVSY